jgi:hypothetical protein
LVRGKSMLTCAKCQAGVPEGMLFCLQCGASVAPTANGGAAPAEAEPAFSEVPETSLAAQEESVPPTPPVLPFRQPRTPAATINLKIAPTPVIAPRFTPLATNPRPSLGDNAQEVDDESLKKAFERPVRHQPGAVTCRFCKGPLYLGGDYCEHCGAPVAEAAPPGVLPPKPQTTEPPPPQLDDDPLADLLGPAKVAPPASAPTGSTTGLHASAAPPPPAKSATHVEPQHTAPPHNPYLTRNPPAEGHPSGLMGRLKGIFKKP